MLTDGDDQRLEKILLLQRLIRSFYVRRQFEQVRQDYLKTLSDIEGDVVVVSPPRIEPAREQTGILAREASGGTTIFSVLVMTIPSREQLMRQREEIGIELLWLEQAIQSRKDYLRLKSRYTNRVS